MSEEGQKRYRKMIEQSTVSTRTCDRLAKVSRTIADLDGKELIDSRHIDEAAKYVAAGILQR
jgi:magnesium chelatase family protein